MGLVHSAVYVFQNFGPLDFCFTNILVATGLIGVAIGSIWGAKCFLEKVWNVF